MVSVRRSSYTSKLDAKIKIIMEPTAFFELADTGQFTATEASRGPWSEGHCHAGPVSGLIVRALEQLVTDKTLTRITLEFMRPVPMLGLSVEAKLESARRTVSTASARLFDADQKLCAIARSLHIVESDYQDIPTLTATAAPKANDAGVDDVLPETRHSLRSFRDFVELKSTEAVHGAFGAKTIWMKTLPLLANETPSPFQSLCAIADCGNGISRNAATHQVGFVNADLTINIHRPPCSEWLASEAKSHWHNSGIGLSEAVIYDQQGPVGVALQSLVLKPAGQ